jgi:hypothetical protein
MTAETNMIYDGQYYNAGDELPDLGSLVCTGVDGNIRSYEGKYEDKSKLPKYDSLGTGSSALLSDEGTFVLYKYYADTQTWEGNGEVL